MPKSLKNSDRFSGIKETAKLQFTRMSRTRMFRRNRTRSLHGIFFTPVFDIGWVKLFKMEETRIDTIHTAHLTLLVRLFRFAEWKQSSRSARLKLVLSPAVSLSRTNCSDRSSVAKTSPNWKRRKCGNRLSWYIRRPSGLCFREHERNKMIRCQEEERTRNDNVVIPEEKRRRRRGGRGGGGGGEK